MENQKKKKSVKLFGFEEKVDPLMAKSDAIIQSFVKVNILSVPQRRLSGKDVTNEAPLPRGLTKISQRKPPGRPPGGL